MKKLFLTAVTLLAAITSGMACTNLIVGKAASADGSVIVSYSADSYGMFGYLCHYPAAVHPEGTMREVYDWDSGKFLGRIPEAQQTYNVVGNINEHQLTIAETTFGGREELVNEEGIIDYGSLIYIALQRDVYQATVVDDTLFVYQLLATTKGRLGDGELVLVDVTYYIVGLLCLRYAAQELT